MMKRKIVIGTVIIAAIIGIFSLIVSRANIMENINPDSIIEPSEITGFIGEKIIGDPDKADVVVYEYADFACSHCADFNKTMNSLIEKYGEKIALVFRSYNLGLSKNGALVARAATAAGIQGYFKEYKDLLFNNQIDWYYEDNSKVNELLLEYFEKASNGAGDIEKFKEDIKSDAVKTRLKFEQNLGKKINLTETPTFRIDGEAINPAELTDIIEKKIKT